LATELTYHGAASYEIVGPTHRVLIDPFLTDNPAAPIAADELATPDVILVSHAAVDHYGDAARIAARTGTPVICDTAVRAKLIDDGVPPDQITPTTWGIVVEVNGIAVRPAECHHWSIATLSDGRQVVGNPIAFIVETEPGVRIYHYGDTCIFDMRLIGELYRPTVGLLGCTQPRELAHLTPGPGRFVTGEMTGDEAARVAEMLGLDVAIACHYLTPDEEVAQFLESVATYDTTGRRQAVAPLVGETVVIEATPDGARAAQVDRSSTGGGSSSTP
jgi:L-ascorbate metabolism protein UlaG (beta-lactamase superfamily)